MNFITDAIWKCDTCGYKMSIYIEKFISHCPQCYQAYKHLATLYGLHIAHSIPLYIKDGEDESKFKTPGFIALTTGSNPPRFVCHNEEFYEFLNELKREGKINENTGIFYEPNNINNSDSIIKEALQLGGEYEVFLMLATRKLKQYHLKGFSVFLLEALARAPPGKLNLLQSPEKLKYHQEIIDFLRIPTVISNRNLKKIERTEKKLGLKLPESVKEWYSLQDAYNILSCYGSNPIIQDIDQFNRHESGLVEITPHESNYRISFFNTGNDDPTVYYERISWGTDDLGTSELFIESFSKFIYDWIVTGFFQTLLFSTFYKKREVNFASKDELLPYLNGRFNNISASLSKSEYYYDFNSDVFIQVGGKGCRCYAINYDILRELEKDLLKLLSQ